ncbi:MAG: lasso peptide biosynthesis B2 protein [Planctomycetota bacterium]
MRLFWRLFKLPARDRRLLVGAWFLLAGLRIGLRVLPFRWVQRRIARRPFTSGADSAIAPDPTLPDRVAWALSRASRYQPGRHFCLPQALCAQVLLRRGGHASELRFGVFHDETRRVRAHAWVECAGAVVVGGAELARFTPLERAEEWR